MGWDRLRLVVADNLIIVIAVVAIVTAIGGYLTVGGHLDPGTELTDREVARWDSTGSFSHRATVTNGTGAFESGAVLQNQSVYFSRLAPRLNGTFSYRYRATNGGSLDVATTVALVIRSVSSEESDRRVRYWRVQRPLASATNASLGPGDRATVPFALNVSAASVEARDLREQHGASAGTVEVVVAARTALNGTRNGRPVDATRTYELPVTVEDGLYRVGTPQNASHSGVRTEQVAVPADRGPLWTLGGPLLGLLGLLGLAGLVLGHRRDRWAVDATERTWLDYRRTREEFDDWITTGRVPAGETPTSVVEVDSLEGLVDVAIDTDNRVIEDETRGACLVLTETRWFRYSVPQEPTESSDLGALLGGGAESDEDDEPEDGT